MWTTSVSDIAQSLFNKNWKVNDITSSTVDETHAYYWRSAQFVSRATNRTELYFGG